ncbi:MAG: haloacid dehalogenase type II [Acidobacteria bacterium]|nr:MAG: haloacid dehalogenase type II [Acidobacteriota bacterium]
MNTLMRSFQFTVFLLVISFSIVLAETKPVHQEIKAILFDGFVIFDPRPLVARAEKLYPGHGVSLCEAWRTRQFEYTWLRSLSGRYVDFWKVTEDALIFAAKSQGLDLTDASRKELMNGYLELNAWPDVVTTLKSLKAAGIRLGFLTNFTPQMLDSNIKNAGLEGFFEKNLSTDIVKTYKPDPRAYQMGIDTFGLQKKQILFAAFAGWDAAGAKSFGYPTFWVNRLKLPAEQLEAPDSEGGNLNDLLTFVLAKPEN